ncbi:ABC-2 transporter permease [Pseudobutyrivibrio ruminis]|uniref:ABC-2 transporter permease n=1 Tax=Pseudobutyrivibrio ruminis TaxID=46206 RepID=A0A2G3DWH2_9FIRM|nr:ABC-2 transporter permease [Pseudobutyrivibrio ruminis]PHU35407.1 hypothetical protein CSX01_05425 [Pseudobutyrivibrio ruminis]
MFALVRKNFIIAKRQLLFMMLFGMITYPILYYRMGAAVLAEYLLVFMILMITILLINNTISLAETTDEKALAYICITPYGRKNVVISKYIFDLIMCLYTVILLLLEKELMHIGEKFHPNIICLFIVIAIICRCVLIPIEIKFGYEKAKYFSMIAVMVFPFVLPMLINSVQPKNIIKIVDSICNSYTMFAMLVLIGCVSVGVSLYLSISIFKKKEL